MNFHSIYLNTDNVVYVDKDELVILNYEAKMNYPTRFDFNVLRYTDSFNLPPTDEPRVFFF